MAIAQIDGTLIKWLNRLSKAKLLIFDDFSLQPLAHQLKLTPLQLLEDRYDREATIICSQLPVTKWYEYLNSPWPTKISTIELRASSTVVSLTNFSIQNRTVSLTALPPFSLPQSYQPEPAPVKGRPLGLTATFFELL